MLERVQPPRHDGAGGGGRFGAGAGQAAGDGAGVDEAADAPDLDAAGAGDAGLGVFDQVCPHHACAIDFAFCNIEVPHDVAAFQTRSVAGQQAKQTPGRRLFMAAALDSLLAPPP